VSEQATTDPIEQVPTNGGRQCSGCHRRNAELTLFENGKLYCTICAGNVSRLGIEPVLRDEAPTAPPAIEDPAQVIDVAAEPDDHHETVHLEREEEPPMASQPVQPEEIGVMPSLASTPSDVSLHGVLEAERARLLEQRTELDRRFRADVDAIDQRLAHVESLLGEQADMRAS